jgi:hypothetical protein
MALFYDNVTTAQPVGVLKPVERVYCLRFSQFTDAHWKRLREIYALLPEWATVGDGMPYWFGPEEDPPYLTASLEPSGIVVDGLLSEENWQEWDRAFQNHLSEFPTFEV